MILITSSSPAIAAQPGQSTVVRASPARSHVNSSCRYVKHILRARPQTGSPAPGGYSAGQYDRSLSRPSRASTKTGIAR